jgi:FG-GAP-like repeat
VGELSSHRPFRTLRKSSTTSLLRRASMSLMMIGLASIAPPDQAAIADRLPSAAPSEPAEVKEIKASAERPVPTRYVGDDGSRQLLAGKQAVPRALAAADFDEDGVPDLVGGYAAGGVGIITLHRGNVDSTFPNTPAAKRRRATGRFSDSPFAATAHVVLAPAAPDFLYAEDFDADGHADVLAAAKGGDALLLRGDGKGGLHAAERTEWPSDLPSQHTSLAVGDLDEDTWKRYIAESAAVLPMRLNMDGRADLVLLRPGQTAPYVVMTEAGTLVVTNTNDSGPGSLRQAILDANASETHGVITFAIPGPGLHTITPLTPLPAVDGGLAVDLGILTIDATTQPGFAGSPVIELSGAVVGTSGDGLTIRAPLCVVRGLVINRFDAGIRFSKGEFVDAIGGFIEGNYIGTDVSGTVSLGNSTGLHLQPFEDPSGSVREVLIGGTVPAARNIISGNGRGIVAEGGNLVQGNFIGTDVTGTVPLGNVSQGVFFEPATAGLIGGTAPGARNIISGNGDHGILLGEGDSQVTNNYIGTDVSGTRALGNAGDGIHVGPSEGGGTITGNVISANSGYGVNILISGMPHVDVLDNRIGTNSAGTAALGNLRSGIWYGSFGRMVSGNLISGNGEHGLVLAADFNTIQGNRIGTDVAGMAALGNLGDGVRVLGVINTIGATNSDPGNVIAFNGGNGIATELSSDNAILSNAIFSNGGLGIDLGNDSVTPNDVCDSDTGVNNELQNFPVLTAVDSSASSTTIQGQLNSSPSTTYQLQFFSSAAADPSGFGEGATLLGSTMVTTDSTCNASFAVTLPVAVAANHFVTATATAPEMVTSEFSNAVAFVAQTPQEATRLLIQQVRTLVAQGELKKSLGLVLEIKLRVAIFFMDRGHFRAAAQQLRGFNQLVAVFVKTGTLGAPQGQALTDAANAIIDQITPSP